MSQGYLQGNARSKGVSQISFGRAKKRPCTDSVEYDVDVMMRMMRLMIKQITIILLYCNAFI